MTDPEMKAVLFEGAALDASLTRVGTVPIPTPGPGELVVDVSFAGINFKDIMARRGDPGYAKTWPFVPGLEVAGTVRAIGAEVDGFTPGDRVLALTNSGGLAQQALAAAALTVRIPDGVPAEIAAVVPGAMTTAHLLLHHFGRIRSGDNIVVHSASGAVGSAVAQLASQMERVRLVGVVGSTSRIAPAVTAGYEAAFTRSPGVGSQIRQVLGDRGADLVFDPQGTDSLDEDLAMLAPSGRIILFGNASGNPLQPLPQTGALYGSNASIGGFSLEALSRDDSAAVRGAMSSVLDLIARGQLELRVTVVNGLAAAASAQQRLADGLGEGKYVVRV